MLRKAISERARIDRKIIVIQNDLAKLAPLCGMPEAQHPLAEMGVTDAVRSIVGAAPEKGVATAGVRKVSAMCGVRLPESNPLAAIQTALKRLESKGEIERRERKWVWISNTNPPTQPIPEWMLRDPEEEETGG